MSAPPTTRATRSRYSSPAVGGAGGGGGPRGSNESSRARDKESREAASLDRSRQFMEAWIEPERAKLASFQEDGLVRQGVLETMEPLGTRPKPAMVRKLMGASSPFHGGGGASGGRDESSGQDGSASTSTTTTTTMAGPRKTGGKRIVLKRKNGNGGGGAAGDNSSNGRFDMSGTQSPTPSTAVATPHPSSTPAPEAAPEAGPGASELEPSEGAEAAPTRAREIADSESEPETETEPEPEPEPEQDDQPEPALPLLLDNSNKNNSSPAPTASPVAAAAAKQRPSASIPPTSDIIQPESEDQPTSELTPTALLHSESVLRSSPTPRQRRPSQSSPSPCHHSHSIPHSLPPLRQPALATRSLLFPPKHSSRPLLPDPVKQSIEDLPSFSSSHQPSSPRSVASFNDIDDAFFKRESSTARSASAFEMAPRTRAQSAMPQQTTSPAVEASTIRASSAPPSPAQPQVRDGPHYTPGELERIIAQKEVVEKSFDAATDEALSHHNYAVAYAFRTLYEEYEDNARFLLLAESIFRQTASADSVFNFGLYLNPRIAEGNKDRTALKYFEPEARENKEYVPHPPQAAPYRDHISLDLSRLQELGGSKKRKRDEDTSADETSDDNDLQPHEELQRPGKAEAEPDTVEVEPEAVATPPHPSKRQKLQNREPSTGRPAGRKKAAPASATRGMNGRATASPLRRKTRSGSVASDSSLSTAKSLSPPLSPQKEADEDRPMQDVGHVPVAAAAAAAAASAAAADVASTVADKTGAPNLAGAGPGPGPEPQPIAARPRRAPARGRRNANASSEPNANNTNNAGQQDAASTNPVGDAPAPGPQRTRNPRRGAPDFTPTQKLSEDDLAATRRRAARDFTHRLTTSARAEADSNIRDEPRIGSLIRQPSAQSDLSSLPDVEEPEPEPEPRPQAPQPTTTATAATGRGARATRAAKRQHEDGDGDDAASTSPDFVPHGEPSTAVTSRAVTPIRPAKRARTGPRLKVSPVKNKAGTAAGNPRARIDRASPTMNGNPNAQVDNDDFCSACGGNGEIVCCDGCTRAFHQLCHDPFIPHSVLSDEDEEWYCWDCSIKRDPGLIRQHKGPWGQLLTALDKKHAVSYRLPKKTREYFEGVKTGPDGEYEDFVPQPKGSKKQKTVETKDFDFHQVVDKDNNPVLCHACRTGTRQDRPILPCSACGLWWHIDCLDPPRAITPNPSLFTCPCHVENLQKAVGPLGPAHKFRKIKGQSEIVYGFRRGNINNGYIEIEDDDPEPAGHSGFRDQTFGHVYRVSSSGVRADFMQKVSRKGKATIHRPSKPITLPRRIRDGLRAGSDRQRMQAAIGLMRLAEAAQLQAEAAEAAHAALPCNDARTSTAKMDASNESLDSASVEELTALEEATRRRYDRIVSELKKRKEQEHQPSGVSDSSSNVAQDSGPASTKTPRRSGRLTGSSTAEGQQSGGAADRTNPVVNDTETPKKSPAKSKVEPPTTAANDSVSAPLTNQKTAKDDDDCSVTQIVSNIVDAAVASVVGQDCTSAADTIAGKAANVEQKIDQDPAAQAAIDSALTPVSEANKDGDDQTPAVTVIKPTTSGVETPETEPNVPDQATSPANAMELG